jgi:hypothetical protein
MKDLTYLLQNKEKSPKLIKQEMRNILHKYCRDIDYYIEKGWSKKEATRYVHYWYTKEYENLHSLKGGRAGFFVMQIPPNI